MIAKIAKVNDVAALESLSSLAISFGRSSEASNSTLYRATAPTPLWLSLLPRKGVPSVVAESPSKQ